MTRSHFDNIRRLLLSTLIAFISSTVSFFAQTAYCQTDLTNAAGERGKASISSQQASSDWPVFLGPGRDNKSPETGILTDWSDSRLSVLWERPMGTGYSMGVVSDGRYFHFERQNDEAVVYCLQAETGKEIWRFGYATDYGDMYGYNNGPRCSPLVDGDLLYTFGVEGMLHCLDASTGKLVWKVDTAEKFGVVQNFFGVGSTPVVEGDLLIAMVGGATAATRDIPPGRLNLVEGDGTGIVAFDKRTGEIRYRITDELASYASLTTTTIGDRRWAFAFARGGLVAFEPLTGQVDFEFPWRARILESVNASTPVVVDDTVFISETYGPGSALLEVQPGKFNVVWQDDLNKRTKAMQTHWNTAIHHAGFLYGCSGRHTSNAELRCIEHATGKVMWTIEGMSRSSLLYADGHFICLGEFGELFLFKANPDKFELVTQWDRSAPLQPDDSPANDAMLEYPCWASPVLANRLLYVRGNNRLVCLELILEKTLK